MRKIIVFLTFSLFFISSFSAQAETHRQFRRQTLWHLVAIPAYFLLNVNVHEGLGHALTASIIPGMDITSYRPYPHFIRRDDGTRNFVFGSTYVVWDETIDNSELAYFLLSPYIVDLSIFMATDLMLSFGVVPPGTDLGGMMFIFGMFSTWIDFTANVIGSLYTDNDISKAARYMGINPAVLATIGALLSIVALSRIVRVGINVFTMEVEGPRPRRRLNIIASPFAGENSIGIAIGGAM